MDGIEVEAAHKQQQQQLQIDGIEVETPHKQQQQRHK